MSKVEAALAALGPDFREPVLEHIRGGTSAEWLADWFKRAGFPVGASSIKRYRKKVRRGEQ